MAKFSANQSICTISIEIVQAAINSFSSRVKVSVSAAAKEFDMTGVVNAVMGAAVFADIELSEHG